MDETYIGGTYHGPHGKTNRLTNKEIVIGIKQRDGELRFFHAETNGIESAFSLLKRGIIGSWHKVSAKHLSAYLDEMTFKIQQPRKPYLFPDT